MKKIIAFLLIFIMFVSCFGITASAQGKDVVYTGKSSGTQDGSKEHPYGNFSDALSAVSDGGTICIVSGSYSFINDCLDDKPFVIDKSVTITTDGESAQKGAIVTRSAGILLSANVTFDNVDIGFANPVHNCIMANGYELDLINVGRYSGHFSVHVFVGGMNGYTHGNSNKIYIGGKNTELGNIYSGGLNSVFNADTDITIDFANGMKTDDFFSSGASEAVIDRDNWFDFEEPEAPTPDPNNYPVSGIVNWTINGMSGKTLDGSGSNATNVICTASDTSRMSNINLLCVDFVTVTSGIVEPSLITCNNKSGPNISINENAVLDMTEVGSFTARSFYGGGTLVLGIRDSFTINGDIKGTTVLETSGGYDGTSGPVALNHTYVKGNALTEKTFTFNPCSSQKSFELSLDNGNLSVINTSSDVIPELDSFEFTCDEIIAGADTCLIPLVLSGVEDDINAYDYDFVYTVKHNGNEYTSVPDTDYKGVATIEALGLEFYLYNNEDAQQGTLPAEIEVSFFDTNRSGTYEITATYESSLKTVSDSVVIKISGSSNDYSVSYNWSDDFSYCTASAVCPSDSSKSFSEKSTASVNITKPDCVTDGKNVYTAVFEDKLLETQIKEVVISATGHKSGKPIKENETSASCTEDGKYDVVINCSNCDAELSRETRILPATGHSFGSYKYNNDATIEKDGTETAKCVNCNVTDTRVKEGTKLEEETPSMPNENAVIKISKTVSVDYRSVVTVKASATGVDEGWHLEMTINGKTFKGSRTEVSSEKFEIKNDVEYSVSVVKNDSSEVQSDLTKTGSVKCNGGFFKILIAFFKGLFGKLPNLIIKP